MVFFKNNRWHISTKKVTYTYNNEELTQYVGSEGENWWNDLFQNNKQFQLIKFTSIETIPEQIDRLEVVNGLLVPEGHKALVNSYVVSGVFPDNYNHPLGLLQTQIIDKSLEQMNAQSSMEAYTIMGIIQEQNELGQAEMLMEVLNTISELINPQVD